jgi:hypothetical protein
MLILKLWGILQVKAHFVFFMCMKHTYKCNFFSEIFVHNGKFRLSAPSFQVAGSESALQSRIRIRIQRANLTRITEDSDPKKKQCFLRYDFKRFYIEKQVMYSRYPRSFSSSSLPTKIGQLFWVLKGTRQNCHSTFP